MARRDIANVLARLEHLRDVHIWPNGPRDLWADAFGVLVLITLHHELRQPRFVDEAEAVVAETDRVLGRPRGYRISEGRDGQHFHHLAMWIYALTCLGRLEPAYRARAIALVRDVHDRFVVPGVGVHWKMKEDLSGPYPGFGLGAIDPFHGYVVYRLLAPTELAREIAELGLIVEQRWGGLEIEQDQGLGTMLWLTHFFPHERWAVAQKSRALATLDEMWVDPPGYFGRACGDKGSGSRLASANYLIGVGLQAVHAHEDRVRRLHAFFDEPAEPDPVTQVMACASHLPGVLLRRLLPTRAASGW